MVRSVGENVMTSNGFDTLNEADRLRIEIEKSSDEIHQLERLAGTVSLSRANAEPYVRSHRATSSTTGKIIEHLQQELDILRLTIQSSRLQLEAEKRAREALRLKCDDLEFTLSNVRHEAKYLAPSLVRKDGALLEHKQQISDLQMSLEQVKHLNVQLQSAYLQQQTLISKLEIEAEEHRSRRALAENQLSVATLAFDTQRSKMEVVVRKLQEDFIAHQDALRKEAHGTEAALHAIDQLRSKYASVTDDINVALAATSSEGKLAQMQERLIVVQTAVAKRLDDIGP